MLKPNVISVLQKKSVKVQAVLKDDTLNNKPIHFGVYNNNKIASMLTFESTKNALVLSSHATLKGTHSSLPAIHNERLLYQ
jgi:hypothetical protein